MAHDELARGMALDGHILLWNHEFARINGLTLVANFCPGQALYSRSLGSMAESHPERRPHHRQDVTTPGTHTQRNHPLPHGVIASDQMAIVDGH
jgi:hypothetical protein